MKKVAVAFSTKNQTELTRQTIEPLLQPDKFDLWWVDGSDTNEGKRLPDKYNFKNMRSNIRGGADSAIAFKLTELLKHGYEYIGLVENDVLHQDGWFEETMALFKKGAEEGLHVGAASPRSYVDRILIQRDEFAIMHNIGAGSIMLTREAAEIVLRTFRTGWWPDVVHLFAQISGIDLRTYAAFRGNEQFISTDWQFEAQLARHGLAALALCPARCEMIGQVPSLAEQGLVLTTGAIRESYHDNDRFVFYRDKLARIRTSGLSYPYPAMIHQTGDSQLFFPHQIGALESNTYQGWKLQWSQGFGPFAYRAGPGGAFVSVLVSGSCSFLATGGSTGAKVDITDTRSGFKFAPDLPAGMDHFGAINVPGGPIPRQIVAHFDEGAVFYGLSCNEPQLIDSTFKFSWDQLPEAE